MTCDFATDFAFAEGRASTLDPAAIQNRIPDCVQVERAPRAEDFKGADYFAHLAGGRVLRIDAKRRRGGCSRWWRGEPDLQLETWSKLEQNKIGWTLDGAKTTDLVLFTYDPADTDRFYLVGFQPLRLAFMLHLGEWAQFKRSKQPNESWTSECMFVPVSVVNRGIERAAEGRLT